MIKISSEPRIGKDIQSTSIPDELAIDQPKTKTAWPIKSTQNINNPEEETGKQNTHISKLQRNGKKFYFSYLKKATNKKGKRIGQSEKKE